MLEYLDLGGVRLHETSTRSIVRALGLYGIPGVRGDAPDRSQQHGAIEPARQYLPAKLPTIEGEIWGATVEAAWAEFDELAAQLERMLDTPATLAWQRTGGTPVQMRVRVAGVTDPAVEETGLPLSYQLTLRAADPRVYAQTQQSADTSALEAGSGGIFGYPYAYPYSYGDLNAGGIVTVTNGGRVATFPTIRLYGLLVAPSIRNATTGKVLSLPGLTIDTGDYVEVDMLAGTVRLNGSPDANLLRHLDPNVSEFWPLEAAPAAAAGENVVRLQASSFDPSALARLSWRDAWI
ncbi:MAG: phage tail family protein [Thermoleophilia bacterium]